VPIQSLTSDDPARIGPYILRGRLGAGGMGVVYLGFADGQDAVAVKALSAGGGADLRRRLRREAELLQSVHDARVARFIAADLDSARPWIAMQYVSGPSLADASTPLAAAPLRQLVDGLAEALAALHRVGLTHRDVKPGNIILTFDGPVLVDLGIAASPDVTSITAHGTVVGTPAWMAPEQLAGGFVGPPADVWGWGAVALYGATGRPPFGDGPFQALAYRIQHTDPQIEDVPPWLRDTVSAALAKDPAQRPTAIELATGTSGRTRQIGTVAATADSARHDPATRIEPTPTKVTRTRQRPWLIIASVLVALATAFATVIVLAGNKQPSPQAGDSHPPASTPVSVTRSSTTADISSPTSAAATTPPVPTTAAPVTSQVEYVSPTDSNGALVTGYTIATTYAGGTCNGPSEVASPYGYRCFGGPSNVFDPCFPLASADGNAVACVGSAWDRTVIKLELAQPLPSLDGSSGSGSSDPWGLQLATGSRCSMLSGARDQFHGRVVGYGCEGDLAVLEPLHAQGPHSTADVVHFDKTSSTYGAAKTVGINILWYAVA